MSGKCSGFKVTTEKEDISFFKYNLVLILLFSITCSALGLSCYAVLKVQNISEDLNKLRVILNRSKIKTTGEHDYPFGKKLDLIFNSGSPIEETLVTGNIKKESHDSRTRQRRSVQTENRQEDWSTEDSIGVTEESLLPTSQNSLDEQENYLHHIKKKAANYKDSSDAEVFTPIYKNVYIPRTRESGYNELEIVNEFSPQSGRLKSLIAIHLSGDTSRYVYGQHSNFNGNGHLRHPQRTFVDWKKSDWVDSLGTDNNFETNNGKVFIKQTGLYFIYAQIYYLDEHDMNGYRVFKNSEILLQCTVTSHSSERMLKGNTCYTAGVTYLNVNDSISVGDITEGRYSLFEPGKSFFGMIRLGDAKIK